MRTRLALLLALLCCLAAGAVAEENLLENGGFEAVEAGLPVGWRMDMWVFDEGVSYLAAVDGGLDGGTCARIENVGSNDARFVQTVAVEPGALYHLSGWIRAEGCDPALGGASLSVMDVYAFFPAVFDTHGEWTYVESWVQATEKQKSIDVAARVGNYSADTTGIAWFDDIALTPAAAAPEGAVIIPLITYSAQENPPEAGGVRSNHLALYVLAPVLALVVWLLVRNRRQLAVSTEAEGQTPRFRLDGRDWALLGAITLVYAVIAFVGLGDLDAPQTEWRTTGTEESVLLDLGSEQTFYTLTYAGINWRDHSVRVEFSSDGMAWRDATQFSVQYGSCFKWRYLTGVTYDEMGEVASWGSSPLVSTARYVRIVSSQPALSLMEVGFRGLDGTPISVAAVTAEGGRTDTGFAPALLVDEQQTVPETPSYLNSMYFDEIYHGRTGYEHAHGLRTYETTHPPLGKVFIMLGIQLFGMTAFGWRVMGTLAGVLMVPAMYLLGKLLFQKRRYALLAAFLMAFDNMHLAQTRIATIDSYAVLFIILMYLCMLRYLQMSFYRDGWKTLVPLGLSGLFMGLGCASKWICFYAGAGLAVLFFGSLGRRFLQWCDERDTNESVQRFPQYCAGTIAACVVFFILVPCAVYYLSYIPWFASEGGLTWERFWNAQTSMFSYHANLTATHDYQSPWYQWPLMLRPVWYYYGAYAQPGKVSSIMGMGNPVIWWTGAAAMAYLAWRWAKPHLRKEPVRDHRPALILLSAAAQFVPWMFVTRATFLYHYFACLVFVMLALVYVCQRLSRKGARRGLLYQGIYMACVLAAFIGFYPFSTGVQVSRTWANAMNWLGWLHLKSWSFGGWLRY